MSKRTLNLSVRDVPTAFDYFFDQDLVVVSSCSDLAFFHLEDNGSPHHVVYYEQASKCSSVRIQHGPQCLVSCVNGGYVSIWDPSKPIKPLVDFIHPSKKITDARWSPFDSDILATSSAGGNLTLWDTRMGLRPTHDIFIGKHCSMIEWCSHNPNLMSAVCEDNYLLVWDSRMMPAFGSADAMEEVESQQVHVLESEFGIVNYAWSPVHSAVYMNTTNSCLDGWCVEQGEDCSVESNRCTSSRSGLINAHAKLLPGPYGERLALLTKKPSTGECAVYVRRCQDLSSCVASNEGTQAPSVESPHDTEKILAADPFVKIATSKSHILDMKWMNSSYASTADYTASHLDLMVLNEDALLQIIRLPNLQSSRSNADLFDSSAAFLTKRTNRSTPLSVSASNNTVSELQRNSSSKNHKYNVRNIKQSLGGNTLNAERPDASYSETKAGGDRSAGSSSGNLFTKEYLSSREREGSSALKRGGVGSRSFLFSSGGTGSANALAQLATNNPQLQMVGPHTFHALLNEDIIALEYGINHGYLEGWRIGRIDQFFRRISLELLIPNIDSYTITNKHNNANFSSYYRSEDLNGFYNKKSSASVRTVELNLIFPVKYVNFWSPTFSVEDKSGLGFNPAAMSSVIIELTAICKSFAEKVAAKSSSDIVGLGNKRTGMEPVSPHFNDCLLFQLTRCFRKRLFKMWEKIIESDRLTISYQSIQSSESHVLSTSLQSEHEMELDVHAPYMKYIEVLAFRVPTPVSSAGVFNSRGQLVCFGNAKICFADAGSGSPNFPQSSVQDQQAASNTGGKHKSFANTLVTKIINTSAGAEHATAEEHGLYGSNSVEVELGGVLHTNGIDLGDTNMNTNINKLGIGRLSPGIAGMNLTQEPASKIAGAQNKPSPLQEPTRSTSRRSRTSSVESDFSSDASPRPADDEGEYDDYQFSFDPDTKEMVVTEPASSTAHNHTKAGIAEEKSSTFPEPLQLPEMTVEYTPHHETGTVYKREAGPLSMGSQQSLFETDTPTEEHKKPASIHTVQVYSALYATELRLLHAYSVGPLSRHADGVSATPITPVAQAVANQVISQAIFAPVAGAGKNRGASRSPPPTPVVVQRSVRAVAPLTQEEALERAKACRQNASSVQQICPADRGLGQFWNLLAVVLDMLTITDSGCLIDWNHCTIGLALLHRLYKYMREVNDLQTFATAICVMGGSDIVVDLLQPYYAKQDEVSQESKGESTAIVTNKHLAEKKPSFDPRRVKKELESVLYAYNDVLHRWGEQLSAVEVAKHINFDHFNERSHTGSFEGKGCELSVKVCCYFCESEIQTQQDAPRSSTVTPSNSTASLSNVTTKNNNTVRTQAQVSFFPGTVAASPSPTNSTTPVSRSTLLWCQDCKDWAQRCVVCELAVRGAVSVCAKCGHGGHFQHMQQWFARSKVCASGCGCHCTAEGTVKTGHDCDGEEEVEEFVEDGGNARDVYDIFGAPPDYMEEIFNNSNEYNYNNFFEKWCDSPTRNVYYEYTA